MSPSRPTTDAPARREPNPLAALWTFFTSMKTAIVLLLALAGVSVLGTLGKGNSSALFQSPWYLLLLGLVGINLAVCSIHRFGAAWRRTFATRPFTRPEAVEQQPATLQFTTAGSPAQAAERLATRLRAEGYRVTRETTDTAEALYAVRGRLNIWGPYLTHVSILLIFIGAVLGQRLGFNGYTTINEGKTTDTYHRTGETTKLPLGFHVGLTSFTLEADAQHHPTGYKSALEVLDGDTVVARQVIDVNHPLTYRGTSFYQSDFGLVGLWVKVAPPTGKAIYLPIQVRTEDGRDGRTYVIPPAAGLQTVMLGERPCMLFLHHLTPDFAGGQSAGTLPLHPAVEVLVNPNPAARTNPETWQKLGWSELGKPVFYQGYAISLEKIVFYTGLSVSSNPGLPVTYAGFALLLAGIFIAFYIPYRQVYALVLPAGKRVKVLLGARGRGGEETGFGPCFARLQEAVEAGVESEGRP